MPDNLSIPSDPKEVPGLPSNFLNLVFEEFSSLNTKPLRPGIKNEECSWLDGFMPLGPNNLRALWGVGPNVFIDESGPTVVWFNFGNIGDTPVGVVLQSDGAIHQFNTTTGVRTQILGAGGIINPSSIMGFSQWGSQYLIFAKDQENGYWLWDGTNVFTAGTVGPVVSLTNGGENYTSSPTITVQTTGSGTGVAFSTVEDNGSVTEITVTNPGSGFAVGDFINLVMTGGGSDDSAIATVNLSGGSSGGVDQVVINNPGNGYSGATQVIAIGGGGSGATFAPVIGGGGAITSVAIVNRGIGYTSPPTIIADDPGYPGAHIPGGLGFSAFCNIEFGQVTGINIVYPGSGYFTPPIVTILGDGQNAVVISQIEAGQVTGFIVQNSGGGYTKALANLSGGNNAAEATISLMPFGVSGTSVEIYQGSVWVTNGAASSNTPPKNRTIFSAPSSPVDFGDGGGAFASFDSFLRIGYHCLKQTNGFLYLIGDSSINYISGVQTSAPSSTNVPAQAVTTFGNQNVDPQLGSPWPSSVQVFSRNIVFANSIGIFVSYGGAVTKVSLPLDGFYGSGPIYGNSSNFSSAVAVIFGIPVYVLLLPVVDPFTNATVNKLLMWDGKRWFTSQQDKNLTYIATQEINSVLTAWGTDGTNIFQLFVQPSVGFSKVVQSKLYSTPGYFIQKTATRLHGVVNSYALDQPLLITIDNEKGLGTGNASQIVIPGPNSIIWTNNLGNPISWGPLVWGSPGLDVFGPFPVAQQGRMVGLTVQTSASDIALLSFNVTEQAYTINV